MPEIKNNFLQGKMNKDLDDRLLPNGQYRDAQNITVSKSENSDVGTVQNVKGNAKLYNTSLNLGSTYETIGYFADSFTGDVFWFVTDFSATVDDNTSDVVYATNSNNCRIYYANANSQSQPIIIIDSYRLNFNKNYKILHVNKLGDLLFWTDDYNQPRRINLKAKTNIADLKNYYTNDRYLEDKISVAQYSPYAAPEVSLSYDSSIKSKHIEQEFVKFGYRFKYDNNEYSLMSPFTQHCFHPGKANQTFNDGTYDTTGNAMAGILTESDKENAAKTTIVENMINKANKVTLLIDIPFDETKTNHASAKVNDAAGLTGTSHVIDNASGTIAADDIVLTTNNDLYIVTGTPTTTAFDTTESVSPTIADNTNLYFFDIGTSPQYDWSNELKIKEIEILYSESDSAAIKVIDRIKVNNSTPFIPTIEAIDDSTARLRYTYQYVYKSTKPTKTLPEADLIRVNDVIPVKAKTQEISGNRVIYGNFLQNRNTDTILPNSTVFDVSSGDQGVQNKQYLLSSVKSNRTYQVGIVLSDRYGRQSPVIIPETSTTFVEPQASATVVTNGSSSWTHSCLRATFNQTIGNDIYDADTNPLGWYSYRFVVKQTEQDYYNVYTPQLIQAGTPTNLTDERSFIYLHGDNINKVPRDVTDINTETGTQGSQVRLLPKVTEANILNSTRFNGLTQLEGTDFIDVTSIGTSREQSLTDDIDAGNATDVLNEIYKFEKNPLMGELPDGYGATWQDWKASPHKYSFYVFETYPFISVLDIYYETSSAGLLKDLNDKILASAGAAPTNIVISSNTFDESDASGTTVGTLTAKESDGDDVAPGATFVINSITDGLGGDRTGEFAISGSSLNTNTTFEFKNTNEDNYTINITATRTGTTESTTKDIVVSVQNISPSINVGAGDNVDNTTGDGETIAAVQSGQATSITVTGKNGSAKTSAQQNNLTFSIVSQTNSGRYTVNSTTGVISAGENLSDGMVDTLVMKTTDVASTDSPDTDLKITVTGSPYTQFWRSEYGNTDSATAVDEPTGIQVWHDGSGDLPDEFDTVYSNADGSTVFNSNGYWHSMCGPSYCSSQTAVFVFKTDSSGVVTDKMIG